MNIFVGKYEQKTNMAELCRLSEYKKQINNKL